jgi:hypothetical protein
MTQMIQMGSVIGVLLTVLSSGCAKRPLARAPHGQVGVLHVHATHTEAYCKGVAPRPEDYPTAQPWSGVLYLRSAGTLDEQGRAFNDVRRPVLDSIRTDDIGHGQLDLPPGTYILIDRDRATDRRYHQLLKDHAQATPHRGAIDKDCLDQWLRGPFSTVTIVADDVTPVDHHTISKCSWNSVPCAPWMGPLPP